MRARSPRRSRSVPRLHLLDFLRRHRHDRSSRWVTRLSLVTRRTLPTWTSSTPSTRHAAPHVRHHAHQQAVSPDRSGTAHRVGLLCSGDRSPKLGRCPDATSRITFQTEPPSQSLAGREESDVSRKGSAVASGLKQGATGADASSKRNGPHGNVGAIPVSGYNEKARPAIRR
jgi:hypothetical protein